MTSNLATNAVLPGLDREYFLQGDKNGFPLNKQVPKTVQSYSGPGNASLVLDGSDFVVITGTVAGGDLTIDLTDNQTFNNLIGRSITFCVAPTHVGAINIDITGNGRSFISSVAAEVGDVATVATTVGATFTIHFVSAVHAAIVHGDSLTIA